MTDPRGIARDCDGDAFPVNLVEEIRTDYRPQPLGPQELAVFVQQRAPLYDKPRSGPTQPDRELTNSCAAGYRCRLIGLARMLAGAEDKKYILSADKRGMPRT